MAEKKIKIASARGLIIPKQIAGTEKDLRVEPHKPVSVPESYGRSLIENRFAVAYGAAEKPAEPQAATGEKAG
ncbi:hypothetical protein [Breoghania sp. JC706]|uniref:hypothetical protein n=1 Tax=Breoghania sp. JC706 TaxID=3117732 RepID=UPI003007FCA4